MTLDRLPHHELHRIMSIDASRAVAQRLMAMGFMPGTLVKIVQAAPFGDPITIDLSGWRVSLRRSEAALVRTELCSATAPAHAPLQVGVSLG